MLEAIKVLGEHETAKEGIKSVDQYIEKAKLKNTKKVICIVFRKDIEKLVYDHTHLEDYDSSGSTKYLYKTTQHKRYDVTPTAKIKKITKGKVKEKIVDLESVAENTKKRLFLWFSTYNNKNSIVSSLKRVFEEKQKEIFSDFVDKYKDLRIYKDEKNKTIDEQANSILTIKIIENNEEKYLGDFELFKNILIDEAERKFSYRKSFGESESKGNGFCCVCQKNGEVLGFAFPFSFYTVDKRGFAPEFIREDSWKRLPICKECAKHLTAGKEFLDTYLLKRRFYHGYQFYVIPHFILGEIDGNLIKEIKREEKKEEYEGLLIEDDFILEPLKEKGDVLNLIFMFIKPKQGGNFDIARYIEDVPPSWINKLDNTLKEVNNLSIFKEETLKKIGIVGKKKSGDFKNIDYSGTRIGGLIATFFPSSKETGVYSKYFIDIVGDILAQRAINRDLVMNAFMREIRNKHVNENGWNEKVFALKSLMLLLFLNKLNLIKR
jgi:CRISPR-associated protein Csh1